MHDAREPLFEHSLILCGDGDTLTIWNDGEEKHSTDIEGLLTLGKDLMSGRVPDWLYTNPRRCSWDLSLSGRVLETVALRMKEDGCTDPALTLLYGGSLVGPANPDPRKAGLLIEEDRHTIKWAA